MKSVGFKNGFLALLAIVMVLPLTGSAQQRAATADPRVEIAKRFPGSRPEDFRASPLPGLFEYANGADILYVSADGKFALAGDLFDVASEDNLSEKRRREIRLALVSKVPENQMVIFGPRNARHTVTVFTDIDCGYCRKLHSEIARYNQLGIRVRYLFYPREGPDSESWGKAVAVWCSPNRNDAMTRAKKGENIGSPKCASNPVAKDYDLGRDVGLRGTPAIVTEDGDLLPGYVPPDMLIKRLETKG
jgi:thiol:disulfide interchange protein DsbC